MRTPLRQLALCCTLVGPSWGCSGDEEPKQTPRPTPPAPTPVPTPVPMPMPQPTVEHPPNVVLVLLDDVGIDKMAAYGQHPTPPLTPQLDALAAEGMRFTNAWTYASCSPTRAALMTGRYTRRYGLGAIIDSWQDEPELPPSEVTLAERLQFVGYDTSLAGKWHLGSAASDTPTHPARSGFAWHRGSMGNLRDVFDGGRGDWGYFAWMSNDHGVVTEREGYVTSATIDDAIGRVQDMEPPWFLYVALNAAHFPPHVPPEGLHTQSGLDADSSDLELYDAVVEAMDHELGRLFAAVDRSNTFLVVLGDNGSPDFGTAPPWNPERAKGTVHETGIRVPFVVAGPGVQAGTTDALVHAVDVLPTVAEVLEIDLSDLELDGVSFAPTLGDPTLMPRSTVYSELFKPNGPGPYTIDERVIRTQDHKLVVSMGVEVGYYGISADPSVEESLDTPLTPEAAADLELLRAELAALDARFEQ